MDLREQIRQAIAASINDCIRKDTSFGSYADAATEAVMEVLRKQAPVAFAVYSGWARKAVYLSEIEACDQRDRRQLTADLGGSLEAYRVVPLYTSPGAKGEEK